MNASRRRLIKALSASLLAAPALAALPYPARASKSRIYTARFSNLALQGHDTVAYFTQSSAVKGRKSLVTEHEGVKWLFANEAHLESFTANPEKFMPQFGGYCAFSVAKGKLVKGDPGLWHIVDNKLYVNYNKGIHQLWLRRKESMIVKADAQWPGIFG